MNVPRVPLVKTARCVSWHFATGCSHKGTDMTTTPLEALTHVVRNLVDFPEEVLIEESENDASSVVFMIHCAPGDRGKVIGKQGSTIMALRTIFGCITAAQHNRRVIVEVANSRQPEVAKAG